MRTAGEINACIDAIIAALDKELDVDIKTTSKTTEREYEDACLVKEAKQSLLKDLKVAVSQTRIFDNL